MPIRDFLSRQVQKTGYHVLSEWRLKHWPFAEHLRRIFRQYSIDVVLDVGANRGQYRDFLRQQVGYRGKILSFEPNPALTAELQRSASTDPQWTIYPYALGRVSGMQDFKVMASDQWSSFLSPDDSHESSRVKEATAISEIVPVRVATLEEIWPVLWQDFNPSNPYLKLDTQGFDLDVLAGAGTVIRRVRAGQSEVYFRSLYHGAPTANEAIATIQQLGFEITGFYTNTAERSLAIRDADCVFVRPTTQDGLV